MGLVALSGCAGELPPVQPEGKPCAGGELIDPGRVSVALVGPVYLDFRSMGGTNGNATRYWGVRTNAASFPFGEEGVWNEGTGFGVRIQGRYDVSVAGRLFGPEVDLEIDGFPNGNEYCRAGKNFYNREIGR